MAAIPVPVKPQPGRRAAIRFDIYLSPGAGRGRAEHEARITGCKPHVRDSGRSCARPDDRRRIATSPGATAGLGLRQECVVMKGAAGRASPETSQCPCRRWNIGERPSEQTDYAQTFRAHTLSRGASPYPTRVFVAARSA